MGRRAEMFWETLKEEKKLREREFVASSRAHDDKTWFNDWELA